MTVGSVKPVSAYCASSWRWISCAPASAAASAAFWASERRIDALPTWKKRTPSASVTASSTASPGRICPSSRRSMARTVPAGGLGPHGSRASTLAWALPGHARECTTLRAVNPRQRRGLLLIAISALGLLGVFVLVAGYVADVREEVDPKVRLLALAKPVKANQAVTDDMITTVEMPKRWAPATAIADPAEAIGLVAGSDLTARSLLQEGMLVAPPDLAPGEREVAILVDAETGVAGKIGPGKRVDIVATFPETERRAAQARVVVPAARIVEVGQVRLKGGRVAAGAAEREPGPGRAGHVRALARAGAARQLRRAERHAACASRCCARATRRS